MTKINIITATFNSADTLPALIKSLEAQTDPDFSWYVADGGSADKTVEILSSITDLEVVIDSRPDFGIYDALNRALRSCDGEYYLVLGSDDRLYPNAIADYRAAANRTKASFITGNVMSGDKEMRPRGGSIFLNRQMKFISGHSVGTLIKVSMHEKFGYYSKRFPIAADQLFLEKAFLSGEHFFHIDKKVGEFGTDGVSSIDRLGRYTESFRIHCELLGYKFLNFLVFSATVLKNIRHI